MFFGIIVLLFAAYAVWILRPCLQSGGTRRCHWAFTTLVLIAGFSPMALLLSSEAHQIIALGALTASFFFLPLILWLLKPPLPNHVRAKCGRTNIAIGGSIGLLTFIGFAAYAVINHHTVPEPVRVGLAASLTMSFIGYVLLCLYLLHAGSSIHSTNYRSTFERGKCRDPSDNSNE